jgi:hypothetical protein
MTIARTIEAEWLDHLPGDDPAALGSRRDLRRLNALMLHDRIVAGALIRASPSPPRSLVEIGAGDGAFMLSLARQLARRYPKLRVTLVDRKDVVIEETCNRIAASGWGVRSVTADVFDYLDRAPSCDVMIANLFLHHFSERQLSRLFRSIARLASVFIACEPRRGLVSIHASRLVGAVGCNAVTRHDALVSAKAGFRGRELSELWPETEGWQLEEHSAGMFSHCLVARHAQL